MDDSKILITGAGGQLGLALKAQYPNAKATDHSQLDISDRKSVEGFNWDGIEVILNAAGYTNVDGAETEEGRKLAWSINDEGVGNLARIAIKNDLILVHVSTAYVFDGRKKIYTEDDPVSPLGEYAKSKAAGDEKAKMAPKHYIVRTDSVIGEGKNFVRTMLQLGEKGIEPTVVADQIIRPTFTGVLAGGIKHLVEKGTDFGVYNLTNEGDAVSWADFTRQIFQTAGFSLTVKDTIYREYSAGKPGIAPRPLNSVLDLTKIESAGFKPKAWPASLSEYIKKEMENS
jgi:dTDP-4-dehydrorhamnose reductase